VEEDTLLTKKLSLQSSFSYVQIAVFHQWSPNMPSP